MASVVTCKQQVVIAFWVNFHKAVIFKDCRGSSMTALECCTLHVHQGGILWFTWPPPTHPRLITTDESKLDLRPCWSAVPHWAFVSLARLSHFPSALLTSPSISLDLRLFSLDSTWKSVNAVTVLDWTAWFLVCSDCNWKHLIWATFLTLLTLPIHHFSDKHSARHKQ